MAKIRPPCATLLILILISTAPHPSHSSFNQYRTLLSLSHSLLTRVANLRAERGDISGSNRVKLISQKLERGLGLGSIGLAWSVGWDYMRNYAWRELDSRELYGAVLDLNELMRYLSELVRVDSEMGRATWVGQNYGNVLGVSKRLLVRLLRVFRQSGTLRETVETVKREVVEGVLLRDCLEVGSNDLKGLIQVFRDLVSQYPPPPPPPHYDRDDL
ncbi:hypothetical protein JRO89_XS06G0030100 [Xanthoceras sorbifolium]|uniref:Uncharacterized protein n=1 Tax=Xanthoceras sorbifolium TaxID=99658 RepID=A0ABQ8HWF6_9ROSI|nr:hypothetical protein JRO89_XS06G0030100 [Xanthoceras sorbifolium]